MNQKLHVLSLGAFNKQTGEYVYPKMANKKDEYICPTCNKDLILCKGDIRIHHFRHEGSVNPCHRYSSNPTETQIHKDAKIFLKNLLERKTPISFSRNCVCCKKYEEFEIPEITETSSTIEIEYRFDYNGIKIADLAYIDNGNIICIFEICNTHKTSNENRPAPWFEIDAEKLIRIANDNILSQIKIPCIRSEKCDDCVNKEQKIKLAIRTEVERKSDENESDSYGCYSKPIMEMLISIICGDDIDDIYKQWSAIYRNYDDEDKMKMKMNENINIGYSNSPCCCDTYYNRDLLRDIQRMQLYKDLQRLYVNKHQPKFKFISAPSRWQDIHDKLFRLCRELFGCNEDINDDDCEVIFINSR